MKKIVILFVALLLVGFAAAANAGPFSFQVGDNDGYGFGAPDNGTLTWPQYPPPAYDGRSPAEVAATDGAQLTDSYSTLQPGYSPVGIGSTGSVIIPILPGQQITSATLEVDMADFQADVFGPITVNFNGISQNWAFNDGYQVSVVRTFTLTQAEIDAANLAGAFIINFNINNSNDFIAFDYFKLSGDVTAVPIPGAVWLLGSGVLGLLGLRRFRKG